MRQIEEKKGKQTLETETGVIQSQAKECEQSPGAEKQERNSPLELRVGALLCKHKYFIF
jgi:hypothetical protein